VRHVVLVLIVLLAGGLVHVPPGPASAQEATPCPATTEAENEAIARRWTEEALNGQDLAVLDEILAADVVHDAGTFPARRGREAVEQTIVAILASFPDVRYSVDQVITEGDLVVVRWTGRGSHGGAYLGVPATGRPVELTGINLYRIACGRIAEGWSETDGVGILRQIGVLPAVAATPVADRPATPAAVGADCPATSEEDNTRLARRVVEDGWSAGGSDVVAELVAVDYVHHTVDPLDVTDADAFRRLLEQFHAAFPDLRFTAEATVAEGDLVAVRYTATGTQEGEFLGIPPTGREITWTGIKLSRVECGRLAETWSELDSLGRLRQLEAGAATPVAAADR